MMLEGKCHQCGARYYGWALTSAPNQICHSCGIGLEIRDEAGNPFTGYSHISAEEHTNGLPQSIRNLEDHVEE
jgi:hypothetical protein